MLLREFHEEIEYDLLGKIDILDFWRGDVSIRRMNAVVGQLLRNPHSALLQAIAPAATQWSPGDYILADQYDAMVALAGAKLKTGQPVPPYPRPGDDERAQAEAEARHAALLEQNERTNRQLMEAA